MKQNKHGYAHGSVVNIYIVNSLKNRNIDSPGFTVQNGLFGAIKITKDVILQIRHITNILVMEFVWKW